VHGLHPNTNATAGKPDGLGKALDLLHAFDMGINLQYLAAMASTLEELIYGEVASNFAQFFATRAQPTDQAVLGDVLRSIVHDYMAVYIAGATLANATRQEVIEDEKFMSSQTKDWPETLEWIDQTTTKNFQAEESCRSRKIEECKFDFEASVRIVKSTVEEYGNFNDRQCHKLKDKLLEMEVSNTGRVSLADFYKAGLEGSWEFNEKADYLRTLGALDESNPSQPKVIVTNYVSSWVNCLTESKFYSVCCRNECEDYMQVIEKHVGGAMAEPETILRLVEREDMFNAEHPNYGLLRNRLDGMASKHNGKVHIHGRLFAQWLHHAFPRVCPYPHEAGTTNPMTPDDWMAETGHENIKASDDEVEHHMNKQSTDSTAFPDELPWSDEEELFVIRTPQPPKASTVWEKGASLLEVAGVVVLVVLVSWVASVYRQANSSRKKKSGKYVA
jgi:hypothetical protein